MLSGVTNFIAARPVLRMLAQDLYCRISRHVALLPPLGVALEMTYLCNWRCNMCFHHRPAVHDKMAGTISARKSEELSTDEIECLINELAGMGVRHLSLHGGEPLIRPDFGTILEYAVMKGIHVTTFTNATLMTGEIAELLVRFMPDIGVSIHGGEKIHDVVTGVPGSFQKSMAGLRLLQEEKRRRGSETPRIHLACVVSSVNVEHLDEMVDVACQLGLPDFGLATPTFTSQEAVDSSLGRLPPPCGKGCFVGDALLDSSAVGVNAAVYRASVERMEIAAERVGIKALSYPFSSENEVAAYFANPYSSLGKACDYVWYSSVVSAFGDVYPCIQLGFLGFNMGNIRKNGFKAIWRNSAYREFRRKFFRSGRYLPVCAKCCSVVDNR